MADISIGNLIKQLKSLQSVMGNINLTAAKGEGSISKKYDANTKGFDIEETLLALADFGADDGKITDDEILKWQKNKGWGMSTTEVEAAVKSELKSLIAKAENIVKSLMNGDEVNSATKSKFDKINGKLTDGKTGEAGVNPWVVGGAGIGAGAVAFGAVAVGGTIAAGGFAGGTLLTVAGVGATVPGVGWIVAGACLLGAGIAWLVGDSQKKKQEEEANKNIENFVDEFKNLSDEELYLYNLQTGGQLADTLMQLTEAATDEKVKAKVEQLGLRLNDVVVKIETALETIGKTGDDVEYGNTKADEINTGNTNTDTYTGETNSSEDTSGANPGTGGVTTGTENQENAQQTREQLLSEISTAKDKLNAIINNNELPQSIRDQASEALKKLEEAEKNIDDASSGADTALANANEAIDAAIGKIDDALGKSVDEIVASRATNTGISKMIDSSMSANDGRSALSDVTQAQGQIPSATTTAQSVLDSCKDLLARFEYQGDFPELAERKDILTGFVEEAQENLDALKEIEEKAQEAKDNAMTLLQNETEASTTEVDTETETIMQTSQTVSGCMTMAESNAAIIESAKIKSDENGILGLTGALADQISGSVAEVQQNYAAAEGASNNIAGIQTAVEANGTPEIKAVVNQAAENAKQRLETAKIEIEKMNNAQNTINTMMVAMTNKVANLPEELEETETDDTDSTSMAATDGSSETNDAPAPSGISLINETEPEDDSEESTEETDNTATNNYNEAPEISVDENAEITDDSSTSNFFENKEPEISDVAEEPEITEEAEIDTDNTEADSAETDDPRKKKPEDDFFVEIGE